MKLKIYNTLTRKKEIFEPIRKSMVRMYSCGPTVYGFSHIGNFRSFILADTLKRVLKFNGYKVKHIINVTDVGHLTSDADEGEDKIELSARREGKSAKEISEFYFNAFLRDFRKLNLIEPFKWVKATEHIREQIDLIRRLEEKGFTYRTKDGIYFDSTKFAGYGKLSGKRIEGLKAGKRVKMGEKRHKTDFSLWKFSSSQKGKREQEWDSPWGIGFPGWHIECSAMSMKYLGERFDIHTGGEDNMQVHHENEIAQSESATGKKPFVKYWVHVKFLISKRGKMSKSAGEIKTISQLEKENVEPLAFKYLVFLTHYRKPLYYSDEAARSAMISLRRIRNIIREIKEDNGLNEKYIGEFRNKINDDLDMPGAVSVLWNLLRDKKAKGKIKTIKKMDEVFGLNFFEKKEVEIPAEIRKLAEMREKYRSMKSFKLADELRKEINKRGWKISDKKDGYILEKDD